MNKDAQKYNKISISIKALKGEPIYWSSRWKMDFLLALFTFAAEAPRRDKSFILFAAIAFVVDVDWGVSLPLTGVLIPDE